MLKQTTRFLSIVMVRPKINLKKVEKTECVMKKILGILNLTGYVKEENKMIQH